MSKIVSEHSVEAHVSKILPQEPPLFLGLYIDDFCYYSVSDKVEEEFKRLMNTKYTVSYDNQLEWFLGMKFEWRLTEDDL